ncbi:MAG: hypothetical protein PVH19_08280 [Planctomycetia bacterium]
MKETLREFVDSRGLKIGIDRSAGMVRGVKILGIESRNGRKYLPEAIHEAASLYEEAKVNINHDQRQPLAPRDYRDRIGVIRNVSIREGDGLFADFCFNPKHELAEQFLWDAEHAPENVGFSHNVTAQVTRDGDQVVVEKILEVKSVDLVADPATTSGLFESVEELSEKTEETTESAASEEMTEARERLQEECQRLQQELRQLQEELVQQKRRHTIEQLLVEAGLPLPDSDDPWAELTSGNTFFESLLKLEEEHTIREQIYRRAELVKRIHRQTDAKARRPLSRERTPFALPEQPESTETFVRSITF